MGPISVMKEKLILRLIIFLGFFVVLLLGLIGGVSGSDILKVPNTNLVGGQSDQSPARRTLLSLSDEHDTLLVAALDGTINLVDPKSATVLWSFASGSSIYSSYQPPVNHNNDSENASTPGGSYFVDCVGMIGSCLHTELGKVCLASKL